MVFLQLRHFNGVSQFPSLIPLVHGKRKVTQRCICLQAQAAVPSRTQRIMESISVSGEVGGAGGAYSYNALKRLDQIWSNICSTQTVQQETQQVVSSNAGLFSQSDLSEKAVGTFDVVVCGGTLGIFIATALSFKGLRVAIVERNILKGVY